jgi:hypothetical protein
MSPIRANPTFGHALTQFPSFGHALTKGVNRCILYFLKNDFMSLRQSVKILTDLESTHQGLSYEVLHDMVPSISTFDLKVHNI